MHEQRRNLIQVVEHEAVAPGNHCAGERAMRKTVACDEERSALREEPDVDEVENGNVVAQVEEEVVPRTLLICIRAQREEV